MTKTWLMDEDLVKANKFWENARVKVLAVAQDAGVRIEIAEHDDEFLFDTFDCGERIPTDIEILGAIEEYLSE